MCGLTFFAPNNKPNVEVSGIAHATSKTISVRLLLGPDCKAKGMLSGFQYSYWAFLGHFT